MTATPIPRTLAMTVYGDLDVSVIDQLPPDANPYKHSFNTITKEPSYTLLCASNYKSGDKPISCIRSYRKARKAT